MEFNDRLRPRCVGTTYRHDVHSHGGRLGGGEQLLHALCQVTQLICHSAGVSPQAFGSWSSIFPLHPLTFLDPLVDLTYPVAGMDLCSINPLRNVGARSSLLGTSQPEFVVRSACSPRQAYHLWLLNTPRSHLPELPTRPWGVLGPYCCRSPSSPWCQHHTTPPVRNSGASKLTHQTGTTYTLAVREGCLSVCDSSFPSLRKHIMIILYTDCPCIWCYLHSL